MPYAVAALLLGHSLVHFAYVAPAPPQAEGAPEWPFAMEKSWLVTRLSISLDVVHPIGYLLVAITLVALAGAALATIDLVVPAAWWPALVLIGAVASLLLLVLFFHPWIVIGITIDVVLIYLVLVSGWDPFATGGT